MRNRASLLVSVSLLYALFSLLTILPVSEADETSKVYIVYLGEKKQDSKLTTESHHDLLSTTLGSKDKSTESMVYSYKHGFSGFAAKLTDSHVQKLAERPEVVRIVPNVIYNVQTTRSWDFLGLSSSPSHSNNLLHRGKMGDGVIIGVLDTGIWPESKSFSDEGLGPIPSKWNGTCVSGDQFNSTHCNKKIIGARWYFEGIKAELEPVLKGTEITEYLSPRDINGHGTHAASTAAGSPVSNISYEGVGFGTVRGGAPRARLAIYKVCWTALGACSTADILKAIDQAIHDGVDILSLSIGQKIPLFPEFDQTNGIAIGSFHATAKGISVVCAAGNDGPSAQTVSNTAPWVLTVAASSMDRDFVIPITLGDNSTFLGRSLYSTRVIESGLTYPNINESNPNIAGRCDGISSNDTFIKGNVVVCFAKVVDSTTIANTLAAMTDALGIGLIIAGEHDGILFSCGGLNPCVVVDSAIGTKLFYYIRSNRNPRVKLSPSRTIVGKPISTHIASFSSRGPNSVASAILKPDIAAPGLNIIAASSPDDTLSDNGYAIQSGTSMATPHISGIVALIKSLHPTWSPAAIKSALITTAWTTLSSGAPILAEGSPTKVADPFDYGGGIVNPNAAGNPGLVYDMGITDYINYLCSMGYENSAISSLTQHKTMCQVPKPSILDLNLPSITIPSLTNSTTVTRTVTNVGNLTSVYRALVKAPAGTMVTVFPDVLSFNSNVRKLSFKVTVSSVVQRSYGFSFGSLIWTDGVYAVKIPLSVRVDLLSSIF